MTRLNLLLLVALIGSCIYLIQVAHESRRLFGELDRAQKDERQLGNEFQRLEAEKRAQATPLRVEQTAREKLKMTPATPAVTQYVAPRGGADVRHAASSTAATGGVR